MNRVQNLTVGFAGLVLMLWVGLSWGELPAGNDISDPSGNTGGGSGALVKTTTIFNTAYGAGALRNNTSGQRNTASGAGALLNNILGSANTAIGASALSSNSDGDNNTASGAGALESNTHGLFNTASGSLALMLNISGSFNTASGDLALMRNTDGDANTAFGTKALQQKITGNNNTAIGASAGFKLTNGHHNIYLGHPGDATESNTMRLGEAGSQNKTFIAGIANTPQPLGLQVMEVTVDLSSGQLGFHPSSARYKRDIHDMGERSRALFQLRPVTFRYIQDPQGVLQYGLIAEEVAAVYPELVARGAEGTVEGVHYYGLIPLVLNELQHQQHQLSAQSQQLAQLNAQNEDLRATLVQQNAELAARLARLEEAAVRAATLTSR